MLSPVRIVGWWLVRLAERQPVERQPVGWWLGQNRSELLRLREAIFHGPRISQAVDHLVVGAEANMVHPGDLQLPLHHFVSVPMPLPVVTVGFVKFF
jgi:hypothetical protein